LAQTHAKAGNFPRAIAAAEEGIKYAPDDPRAKALLQSLRNR
jgi:hypothetical protein